MFTGIISNITEILDQQKTSDGLRLVFQKPADWNDLKLGESIATDGACLTVSKIENENYECELVPETLDKTTFGVSVPKQVNLERSLAAGERFGGHFVQGHVDGLGTVEAVDEKTGYELEISFEPADKNLIIPKGSITINGVSLTIASLDDSSFRVALVPHTLKNTTLGALKPGDKVNLEFDMIGKYITRKEN